MLQEIHSSNIVQGTSVVADHVLLAFASRHIAQMLGQGEKPGDTGGLCSIPPDRIQRWLHELLAHRAAEQPAESGVQVHAPEFYAPRTAEAAIQDLLLLERASRHVDRIRVWYHDAHDPDTTIGPGPEHLRQWLHELIEYRQHTLRPPQRIVDAPEAAPSVEWESGSEEIAVPSTAPSASPGR